MVPKAGAHATLGGATEEGPGLIRRLQEGESMGQSISWGFLRKEWVRQVRKLSKFL